LTGVFGQLKKPDPAVAHDFGDGGVAGTVVDENQFVVESLEGGFDLRLKRADVFLLIK
jgi:hypothetical protein